MSRQGGVVTTNPGSLNIVKLPATAFRLPLFTQSGFAAQLSDSVFGQADSGHRITIGLGANINAAQVSPNPAMAIGENATALGIGAVAIGPGASANGKNQIAIGSALAFGAAVGDDVIIIGTQAQGSGNAGIAIGRGVVGSGAGQITIGKGATGSGADGIAIGTSSISSEASSIAIGRGAVCQNSGLGVPNKNIAIGDGANSRPIVPGGPAIAIGSAAACTGPNAIAIGAGAGASAVGSIAIGAGAVVAVANVCRFGSTAVPLASFGAASLDILGAAMLMFEHYRPFADVDGNVGLRLMTKKAGVIVFDQVTMGVVDSGGVGFRLLRIPN